MIKYISFIFILIGNSLIAQAPVLYNQINQNLNHAQEEFDQGLFSASQRSFEKIITISELKQNNLDEDLKAQAELGLSRSKLKLEMKEAPKELTKKIVQYYPAPYTFHSIIDLANFYFREKEFDESQKYFKLVEGKKISTQQQEELLFKMGYMSFIKKDFVNAGNYFNKNISKTNKYKEQNIYYSGMVSYYLNDYETALVKFKKVANNKVYRSHIPYYICQIYFAKKEYHSLIEYGEKLIKKERTKKKKEIRLLIGQSYYNQDNYKKALAYLTSYESQTSKLSEDEFYQLAYTQYHEKQYEKAVENFLELTNLKNEMGVMSNYYLADCYLKLGNKTSARTAFKKVSQIELIKDIQEESLFNYTKLSVEQGYDREAIANLVELSNHPKYNKESQSILSEILLQTSDFSKAIETIENMSNKTSSLKNTLVKLYFRKGLQLYNDGDLEESAIYFTKVIKENKIESYNLESIFYKAKIAYNNGIYKESIKHIYSYLEQSKPGQNLPDETNLAMAYYLQANNYWKENEFKQSFYSFEQCLKNISQFENNDIKSKVKAESTIRIADCSFQIGDRNLSTKYYNESIDLKDHNYNYANYQLAIIKGLENKPYDKIILLERITKNSEKDDLTDDAHLMLGDSYLTLQKFNKAFASYKTIVKSYKTSDLVNQAFLKLGLISYNQGDAQDALTFYKEIFAHNPTPKETQEALISVKEIYVEDLGQANEYVLFAEEVAGHKISDFAKDSLNYGIAYNQFKHGKYPEAINKFDHYLKKYKKGFFVLPAQYFRGESYAIQKKYSSALENYQAIIMFGSSEYYLKSLKKAALISYNHSENFKQALEYYKLLLEQENNKENSYEYTKYVLQSAYRSNTNEDIKLFATKLIQHTKSNDQDKTLAFYYSGKTFYDEGKYDQAIPSLNQVVRLNNNEQAAESKYLLASIFYKKAMYDKAKQQCLDISNNTANYPIWVAKSLILLADILVEKDDYFNAKAALEAVIDHFKDDKALLVEAKSKLEEIKKKEEQKSRIKEESNELEMEESN